MNAATERKVIRWPHIIISIPVIGYIYGPVSQIPEAAIVVRYNFFDGHPGKQLFLVQNNPGSAHHP